MKPIFMMLLAIAVYSGGLLVQNETAVLTGRVVDPQGPGVPDARVHLIKQATGAIRDSRTLTDGLYRFDLLPPGDYTLRVSAGGFKTSEDSRIHLQVAQSSSLDVPLTVGAVAESVQVYAEVSPLVTVSAAQGAIVSQEKVRALPLNGRQFLQLALLSPGANSGGLAVQQNSLRQGEVGGLSVAGRRTNDSAYLLDGLMNTDPDYNALNYVPVVDAISEFQVQIAQYSAEYGRASGGQVSVLTQSGSNQWHGSAWEFLRNNVLDARAFNLTTSPDVPEFRRNQFGGLLGGPIMQSKLFGFFTYERLRNRQAAANLTTVGVPDELQRSGNFSKELPGTVIYDPSIPVASGSRTPFFGNIIPPNRINPSVSAAMNALPLPNLPVGLFINTTDVLKQNNDNISARIDAALSQNLRLFTRYSASTGEAAIPVTLPGREGLDNAIPRNVAMGFTGHFAEENERSPVGLQPAQLSVRSARAVILHQRFHQRSA